MSVVILLIIVGLVYLFVQSQREKRPVSRLPERPSRSRPMGAARSDRSTRSDDTRSGASYTIRVSVEDVLQTGDRVPTAKPEDCWVPPGQSSTVQGRTIARGMIYVGRGLRDGRGWRTERALIDPQLPATTGSAEPLSYWPCYSDLTPPQRGRYLDWLAAGAEDPAIDLGYVFIYFYGLERRYFFDGVPDAERGAILAEVRRLHDLYRSNGSFDGYASAFIGAAAVMRPGGRLYETAPTLARRWEPDLPLKLALGQAAVDGIPIPAGWALLWLYQDPETSLRTPATRCPDEVRALFCQRYAERFGEGLVVKPNKTPLRVRYRAASGGFEVAVDAGDLPDLTALKRPLNQLRPLLDACVDDLDAYSRFVGRHPEKRGTREAIGLLPGPLAAERLDSLDDPFVAWVRDEIRGGERTAVDGGELARRWVESEARLTKAGALRKRDAEALAGFLDLLGLGVEPDVRRSGESPRKGRHAILFRRQHDESADEPATASEAYHAAEVVLTLLATVAHADDEVTEAERSRMFDHVRDGLALGPGETERLAARLDYLLHNPPTLRGMEQAVAERLTPEARRTAADLALLTAVADGRFDPAESRVLEKIYGVLGLDPAAIYTDLHALQSGGAEPPVVRPAEGGATGYAVPRPPEERPAAEGPAGAFELDMDLVRAKLADTQKASTLLAGVFVDEDEPPSTTETGTEGTPLTTTFTGLDDAHAALLRTLVAQAEWPRDEYEAAAAEQGLMPGGALETINEWAFESVDDALLEDGNPLLVYLDVWNDLSADA